METKICGHCQAVIERPAWAANTQWASQKYCSHSCVASARHATRVTPTKPCGHCGQPYKKNPRYNQDQWERSRYCSRKCQGLSHKTLPEPPLCGCGCGVKVTQPKSIYRQGHNPTPADRYVVWTERSVGGKKRWFVNGRQGAELWYRVVAWNMLGRELRPEEVVHHINGDSADDRPENLQVFANQSEHMLAEIAGGLIERRKKPLRATAR